ncbi:MAG TPA: hypothetical protein VLF79_00065 [Candidatus Saccharimonadales bacterium]|nr:hypothetical protein [Candidatus Saccharimonadales bacterium]
MEEWPQPRYGVMLSEHAYPAYDQEFSHPRYGVMLSEQAHPMSDIERQAKAQNLGNRVFAHLRRLAATATLTATALLGTGPMLGETSADETIQILHAPPTADLIQAKQVNSAPASNIDVHDQLNTTQTAANPTENKTPLEDCVTIANKPSGFMIGTKCPEDTFLILHDSNPTGYDYGEFIQRDTGVAKCGWIEHDVNTSQIAHGNQAKVCLKWEEPLKHPSTLFIKVNCRPQRKDHTDCDDGSWDKIRESTCDFRAYGNFATSNTTPINLYPTDKNSGFSTIVGTQTGHVLWRADLKDSSEDGLASVSRSESLGTWIYMDQKNCTTPTSSTRPFVTLKPPVKPTSHTNK